MMTRKEAIARIKDHMSVHKIYEERAVKITEALSMAISALEQPEIIRCKDCKHVERVRSEEAARKFGQIYICGQNVFLSPKPDDYCSMAERRTDET